MTAEAIKAEIDRVCRRDWDTELAPLLDRLRRADGVATFHALFQFAAHSQVHGPAALAALLLRRVNPPCPISCTEAVREMLTDWDVSIEEVPFYLVEQFGVDAVRAAVANLRTTITDKDQIVTLGTIDYWLGAYEQMQAYKRDQGAD